MQMNLRSIIIIYISLITLLLIGVHAGLSSLLIHGSYQTLENEQVRRVTRSASNILLRDIDRLDSLCWDWSSWDDTYNFVLDVNDEYVESNLLDDTFLAQQLNAMAFYTPAGELVWGKGMTRDEEHDPELIKALSAEVRPGSILLSPKETGQRSAGILSLESGLLLISSRPILQSNGQGPARGVLIVARFLDEVYFEEMRADTGLDLEWERLASDEEELPSGAGEPDVDILDSDTVSGQALFTDVYEKSALLLRVLLPREIHDKGREFFIHTTIALVIAALLFNLAVVFIINRKVLAPLVHLREQVKSIHDNTEHSGRVEEPGDKEFASLAQRINEMLDELEQSRTDLAQGMAEITENQEFLRKLLDSIQVGVVLIDWETHVIEEVNSFALTIAGGTKERLLGKECHNLLCPRQRGQCPVMDENKRIDLSVRKLLKEDGTQASVLKSATTVERGGRKYLLETFVDISEQIELQKTLERTEQIYRTIFRNTGTATVLVDDQGRVTLANSEFMGLAGWDEREVEKRQHLTRCIHPDDQEKVRILLENSLDDDNVVRPRHLECRIMTSSGQERFCRVTIAGIHGEGSGVVSFLDLTDHKLADMALQQAHDDLERKVAERTHELEEANKSLLRLDELRSTFLSSASHELRTPLTSVLGFAQLMDKTFQGAFLPMILKDPAMAGKADAFQDNLRIILEEGKRLTRLIDDLLDLNKIESGQMVWRDKVLNTRQVLMDAVVAAGGDFAGSDGVELKADIPEDLPAIHADPDRISQVIMNLLSNAAKFTNKGSVTVEAAPGQGVVTVGVRDTGPGIPLDELGQIFGRFYQVQKGDGATGKPMGTGLGLAICKQIVEHYGGVIWVESEPGKGACFAFTLPTAKQT